MSVSDLTASGSLPSDAVSLWSLHAAFKNEWAVKVEVASSFDTVDSSPISAAETRRVLAPKPVREVKNTFTAYEPSEVLDLKMLSVRRSHASSLTPLLCDAAPLQSAASSGSPTLVLDPSMRRFHEGKRVILYYPGTTPKTSLFELGVIDSVGASSITLTENLTNTFPAGSAVVPVIESQVDLNQTGSVLTDRLVSLKITGQENVGPVGLPAASTPGQTPSFCDEYLGFPIFNLTINWNEDIPWGVIRRGTIDGDRTYGIPVVYGSRGEVTYDLPLIGRDREEAWNIIQFWDSRAGKTYPFWLASPTTDHVVSSLSDSSTIIVEAAGEEIDWDFRPYLAFELSDGSTVIRGVSSVSRGSGLDTVTLDETVEFAEGDIVRCTTAYLVRFDAVEMVERWETNTLMETKLPVRELTKEESISLEDLASPPLVALDVSWEPGQCSGYAYKLEPCDCQEADEDIWTDDDLSEYLDDIVELDTGACYSVSYMPLPSSASVESVTVEDSFTDCECCSGVCLVVGGTDYYFKDEWPWGIYQPLDLGGTAISSESSQNYTNGSGFYSASLNRMGPFKTKFAYSKFEPIDVPDGATIAGFHLSCEVSVSPVNFEGASVMFGLFFAESSTGPGIFFGHINQNLFPEEDRYFEATWMWTTTPNDGFEMTVWNGDMPEDNAYPNTTDNPQGDFIDVDVFEQNGTAEAGVVAMCSGGQGLSNDGNLIEVSNVEIMVFLDCPDPPP